MNKEKDWYKELPEYKRLNKALEILHAFQKEHEETIKCKGCKCCLDHRDVEAVLMFRKQMKYPKVNDNCTNKKVVAENLSTELQQQYKDIFKELSEANNAYLKVVRPEILNQ